MAFEEDLGYDPSQPVDQNFTLGATDIITKTISLWFRRIVQYIIIFGIISTVCVAISVVLLFTMFGLIGTIAADPFSYLISFFMDPLSDLPLLVLSMGFAIIAFVLNAIISGAAIKFTLDEYGGNGGDAGTSFSHSISRLLNIIVVQLILGFIIAIIMTPATIFLTRAMAMIDISDPFNPIILPGAFEMLMYAMVLLLIGGIFLIYMNIRFTPTLAVVIDTDLSAIDSLKKSWELTSGNFFHIFGSYILFVLAVGVLGLIVNVALTFTFLPLAYTIVIESILTPLLFGALTYIFATVLYRDLHSRTGAVSSSLDDLML